jgi:triacylglycerol lipase
MPGSRRFAVAVIAVIGAVVLLVVLLTLDQESPETATGEPVAQNQPGPVLLIPGYGGTSTELAPLVDALRTAGRDAVVVSMPDGGVKDLREQAATLGRAVDEQLSAGAPSVDVVGYSSGGVVSRIWADELGGAGVTRRVVTLGSPHHGTRAAGFAAALGPDVCPEACRQLVPDSELLSMLDETPDGPVWTAVWTAQDRVVTPPESARLDGAVNVKVQDVCPDARIGHDELTSDALVVGLVLLALDVEPLDAAPGVAKCASLRDSGASAGQSRPSRRASR